MPARNETTGQYTETYTLEEFLIALRQLEGEVGTKDVEKEVGSEYRTTIAKLHALEERNEITSRKVGNAYLWKIAGTEGTDQSPGHDSSPQHHDTPSKETDNTDSQNSTYDPTREWE